MRLSIFTTIFLIFLLAVMPLYALGILINKEGSERARAEIYASTLENIHYYVSNMEQEIKTIVDTEVKLINNADIREVSELNSLLDDYEFYRRLERIRRELSELRSAHRYIEDAYILFPFTGIKLTATSRQAMADFDRACVANAAFYTGFPIINYADSGGTYINFSSQYYLQAPSPAKVRYIIVTRINTRRIAEEMYAFFTGPHDQTCFIGAVNGLTVLGNADADSVSEIAAMAAAEDMAGVVADVRLPESRQNILLAYRRSDYLKTTFLLYGETERFLGALQTHRHWLWTLTAVMALLVVGFTIWTRRVIAVPMNRLTEAIRHGIAGELHNDIEIHANEEFSYIYRQFNEMLKLQRAAISEAYAQALLLKDTELKALQYQINPHFLYNCFFMMYQMLEANEYDALRPMMLHLGSYFNFITKSEPYVTLEQELRFCADYISIQTVRFAGRIEAELACVPEEWAGRRVPRIVLQPLLENAYKHGLANKEQDGRICLRFDRAAGSAIVEDNGDELTDGTLEALIHSLEEDKPQAASGLWNVHQRLRASDGECGLRIRRGEWGGLLVEVVMFRV